MRKPLSLPIIDAVLLTSTIVVVAVVSSSPKSKPPPIPDKLGESAAWTPTAKTKPRHHPAACLETTRVYPPQYVATHADSGSYVRRVFGAHDQPIAEFRGSFDGPQTTVAFHYDAAGRLDRETDSAYNAEILTVRTFRYDETGNRIEETIEGRGDRPSWLEHWEYDQHGRLVAATENIDPKSHKPKQTRQLEYDAQGRLELERVARNGDNIRIQYRYDERGLLIEKRSHWLEDSDRKDEVITYRYDDRKRLLSETQDQTICSYNYDAADNLQSKECTVADPLGGKSTVLYRVDYGYDCW
jgi:YD repeat-containing protein